MENPEALTIGGLALALITAWVKIRPAMSKIETGADLALRADLLQRIKDLELALDVERQRCAEENASIRAEHKAAIHELEIKYEDRLRKLESKVNTNVRRKQSTRTKSQDA